MHTVKNNINNRIATLSRLGELVFHVDDLANIWKIYNQNTLHTTLKRYVQQGILCRLYRGFYSLLPLESIDPYLLGIKAVHAFAYVSTETILYQQGIISQKPQYISIISNLSKRFIIGEQHYYVRQLSDKFLFQDIGIFEKNGVRFATTERAIADMLYFNPKAYFDMKARINLSKVKKIQKQMAYPVLD